MIAMTGVAMGTGIALMEERADMVPVIAMSVTGTQLVVMAILAIGLVRLTVTLKMVMAKRETTTGMLCLEEGLATGMEVEGLLGPKEEATGVEQTLMTAPTPAGGAHLPSSATEETNKCVLFYVYNLVGTPFGLLPTLHYND